MAKIGFIGTGIMGKPMAQNLQKAGHSLFLSTHHDAAPADLLEAGAILCIGEETDRAPGNSAHCG
ncbi:NAD(P)-binding domain-containing protein, partial [Pseudomonas aeruginosa]|uniref:NAD(P)-binding domain-containing protein n=1 Tax=Pseudomonas aeruginosa TaxID=287 RepID=UPI003969F0D8